MNKGAKGDGHEDQSGSLEVLLVFVFCHWVGPDSSPLSPPPIETNLEQPLGYGRDT